jgi:NAD(P)-dependent dehydrogenase (short-subunit alcohol dehydrogenase family)
MGLVQGNLAVVTGASRGIGKACAALLTQEGAKVVMVSRNPDTLKSARDEIVDLVSDSSAQSPVIFPCDVTDPDKVTELFDSICQNVGLPTILVNNAGGTWNPARVTGKRRSFLDFIPEDLPGCFALNFFSSFYCTQEFVKRLEGRKGSVINISATAALITKRGKAVYGPAKGALNVFTRGVAAELGPLGVRVNSVCPGPTLTEKMIARIGSVPGEQDEAHRGRIPMNRYGRPEDIAKTVLFLASPLSEYVTGCIIPVDGGYSLGV